jgi:hypothetical protein
MAWVKVPPEHHPIFRAALPYDPRVEILPMFGGLAAKVNGNIFAGLFGRSTMVFLPEPLRTEALALEGAERFDPMGDGRARSDKVMLPEAMMEEPDELRRWIGHAFAAVSKMPRKAKPAKPAKRAAKPAPAKPAKRAAKKVAKTASVKRARRPARKKR